MKFSDAIWPNNECSQDQFIDINSPAQLILEHNIPVQKNRHFCIKITCLYAKYEQRNKHD